MQRELCIILDCLLMAIKKEANEIERKLEEKKAAQMEFEDGLKKVHEWFTKNWEDIDKSAEF